VDVASRLVAMEDRDFTYRKPISHFAGEVEYAFKQSFMREVVYGTIPSKIRYRFHAAIAAWLEEKGKEAPDQFHALLAHHYECAREEEKAATHYRAAAAVSKKLNDNRDAITMYTKVLELATEDSEAIKEAKNALGKLYLITGDYPKSEECYQEYLEICAEGLEQAGAFVSLGRLDEARGEYAEALEHYVEAEKQIESVKPGEASAVRGKIMRGKAGVHMRRGESDRALELCGQALDALAEYRKAVGDPGANAEAIASTLNAKGLAHQQKGDLEAAMQDFLKALKEYRRIGDKQGEGMVLNNIGIIHYNKQDLDSAEDYYTRSRDISSEVGDMQGRANAISNVGLINQTKCQYEKAVEELTVALDIRRRMGVRAGLANSLINLVIIYLILGHSARADEILEEMSELCQAEEHKVWRWYESYCRGEALRLAGDFDAAKESFGKARELAQEMKNPTMEGWSVQSMAQLALSSGDFESSISVAAEAGEILKATGDEKAVLGVRLVGVEALTKLDRLDDAEKELDECGEVEETYAGDRDILFNYLKAQGMLKEKRGDGGAAAECYRKAMNQRESIRSELGDPELAEAYDNRPDMKEVSEALARVGGGDE
jgi:tetratricopeptide (TPR) repeat protein